MEGLLHKQKDKEREREREELTNGGRHSSACFLSTENPPWVLVSEAVRIFVNIRGCVIAEAEAGGDDEEEDEETDEVCDDGDACNFSS